MYITELKDRIFVYGLKSTFEYYCRVYGNRKTVKRQFMDVLEITSEELEDKLKLAHELELSQSADTIYKKVDGIKLVMRYFEEWIIQKKDELIMKYGDDEKCLNEIIEDLNPRFEKKYQRIKCTISYKNNIYEKTELLSDYWNYQKD